MSNDQAKGRKTPGFYLNRVSRMVLACILVAVAIWPVGIQPQATQAAPVYAPQTPTPSASPTPTPTPLAGEGAVAQVPHTPPSPDNLPPEVEQARARQAMEAALAKYLSYWGPRYQVAPIEVAVEGEWAHGVAQWQSETKTLSGPIHILARRSTDGAWQALMPGSDGLYRQWVDAVPESLVPTNEKSQLRTQAVEANALRRPQATPAVPPAKTAMPPGKEGPGEPVEPVPGLMQPTATPTLVLGLAQPPATPAVPLDAQSTTGPTPPPGTDVRGALVSSQAATVIPNVPAYVWHHGCGPTAAGMIIGYHDTQGFDDLVPGDSDAQTAAVNAMIASEGPASNYTDYCKPIDSYPNLLFDMSEPPFGDEHSDNCLADYMETSQSYYENYYGWSWFSHVGPAMENYVNSLGRSDYDVTVSNLYMNSTLNWDSFRAEIDAGWPMVFLVDTDKDGKTDHFVTAIGYDVIGDVQMYAVFNTWDTDIHWFEFAPMASEQPWGIYGAVIFQISQSSPGEQVKLYSLANYQGSVVFSGGTGFSNDPNAESYSMEIPSGWSVWTWRGDNRGGGEPRCWSESVRNLEDHGWHLAIQSIEVFDSNECPQPPPLQQVKLFSLAGWGGDIVFSGGTGFSNEPNADSYSMEIPSGWSVKTWRGDNRGGGEPRCWSESVRNLQDHGWHLAIQSIEVFDWHACPMRLNFTTGLGHQAEVEIVVTSIGDPDDQLSQNNVATDSQGNGSVELSGCVIPGRRYDIYAKPDHYLRQKESNVLLQPGTNSVAFDSPFLYGDIFGNDNAINVGELLTVLEHWGSSDPVADLDGDGTVGVGDFLLVLSNWGEGAGWTDSRPLMCGTAAISAQDAIGAQDANGSITLTPDAGTFNVGDTFDMQVLLDTGGHETDGVDLIVLYDPGVLAVQDTDPITGTQISAGSIYTNTRANTVIPSLGEIRYSADVGQDGIPFQGSGTLAAITFTVTAAISNTAVKVYYQDGWTGESNIVESETITDVLGYANTASFQTIGSPSRPMPSISFIPISNAFVNTSLVELEAEATDPYNQVKEVEFEVNLSGVWTTIGSDTFGPYWKYRWDASSVPDGVYDLRASALLLGGEGTTVTNSNIMLDRTLPTYISSTITPLDEPYVGVPVEIEVTADDEGSGVDHIDVYARKVYDSAVHGEWNFIGTVPGSQGSLVWDTSGYSAGTYQIAFSIQDQAGNWGPDSQPELLLGLKGKVFLPVILKNSDGTAPPSPTIGTLNFKVSFQGRDNAAGQLQNVPIKVKIKNQSGDQTLFESDWVSVTPVGDSNNWGTASVDVSSAALTPGQTYQVLVKGAMHLAKRITTSLVDGQTIDYTDPALNPDGFLRAGDIDQDNEVGAADVDILLSHWGGTPPADPDPDPSSEIYRSDLDGDGAIATSDYLILLDSWGTGDPY